MLTIRRRKAGGTWYCRGTVRVGAETRDVEEHTTGLRDEGAAETYRARLQTEIENDLLYGRDGRTARLTFADAGQAYLARSEPLHPNDIWRVGELNEILGDYLIRDIRDGWTAFRAKRCAGLAPATVDRFRAILQAAMNHLAEEKGFDAPRVKPVRFSNKRIRFLTVDGAERLIEGYPKHVRPIALTFRYQGCRTQEALQLQIPAVDFKRGTMFFDRTKNGEPRTVKMHDRVAEAVDRLLHAREYPEKGHVFLNRIGRPYADTRDYKLPGGNPLSASHRTALAAAKVQPIGGPDFTVHDWRHHWACHCVMAGIDLPTIQRLGGWKDLRMLERYTAVSDEHLELAVERLAAV